MFYNIDYHITDRCNRKCVSCGHFVPLVPKTVKNKSMEQIETDLRALARFQGLSLHITLTGGECTLHPNLREILLLAIELFPDTEIRMVSNGTNPDKLIALKDILDEHPNVVIIMTNYNSENTDKVYSVYKDSGQIIVYGVEDLDNKTSYKRENFHRAFFCEEPCTSIVDATKCHQITECAQLVDKKIYACQYLAHFHYFKDYFGDQIKIPLNGDEGIELDKCSSNEEIENYVYNHIQEMCFHCLDALRKFGKYENLQPLTDTKYELDEWYIKSINNEEKKDDNGE